MTGPPRLAPATCGPVHFCKKYNQEITIVVVAIVIGVSELIMNRNKISGSRLLPKHSLKLNPSDVFITCKVIIKGLARLAHKSSF